MICRVGQFDIDLSRVKDYHFDTDSNLIVTFDDGSTTELPAELAGDFLAHWNTFSPPPASV